MSSEVSCPRRSHVLGGLMSSGNTETHISASSVAQLLKVKKYASLSGEKTLLLIFALRKKEVFLRSAKLAVSHFYRQKTTERHRDFFLHPLWFGCSHTQAWERQERMWERTTPLKGDGMH